ncbi:hypothetical protein HQ865_16445 [Mucilaginibacter mali]|uniref:Uncharacterized protein n=1 Tax=Mucilaginibacter mali TaxID=2740462 RepID=A0A7D4UPW3_9SPHI|nr:hypothetical protein [Mucilaginibacter mali]QKJ31280.1 hypothetical protein HQ865_16445 [Mucilaginibacter mali]
MNLKKAYYYLFYKFYKFGEASPSLFPNDLTAAFAIDWLEALLLASIGFYLMPLTGRNGHLSVFSFQVLLPLLVIFLINHFAFIHDKRWKKYIDEFDRFPQKKNNKGTWFVIGIIAFIIINFGFSVYVMKQVPITP